jgi:hypothetical protein
MPTLIFFFLGYETKEQAFIRLVAKKERGPKPRGMQFVIIVGLKP